MAKKMQCKNCRFARQDKAASEYTKKQCNGCEIDKYCTCGKKQCRCGEGCEIKHTDHICPKQKVKWTAYECGCPQSDYFKSLLNVTPNGDKQTTITWSGCEHWQRQVKS